MRATNLIIIPSVCLYITVACQPNRPPPRPLNDPRSFNQNRIRQQPSQVTNNGPENRPGNNRREAKPSTSTETINQTPIASQASPQQPSDDGLTLEQIFYYASTGNAANTCDSQNLVSVSSNLLSEKACIEETKCISRSNRTVSSISSRTICSKNLFMPGPDSNKNYLYVTFYGESKDCSDEIPTQAKIFLADGTCQPDTTSPNTFFQAQCTGTQPKLMTCADSGCQQCSPVTVENVKNNECVSLGSDSIGSRRIWCASIQDKEGADRAADTNTTGTNNSDSPTSTPENNHENHMDTNATNGSSSTIVSLITTTLSIWTVSLMLVHLY